MHTSTAVTVVHRKLRYPHCKPNLYLFTVSNVAHAFLTPLMKNLRVYKSAKYLGVHIDRDLSFKHHIQLLHNKLSRTVGILYKNKKIFHTKYVLFQHTMLCLTPTFFTASQSGPQHIQPISTQFVSSKTKKLNF